ncbi:hypothetical protein FOA52_011001 [Chlamydomonas sp. UWO 241]|nr:hypothetical protein FOA52_011001 [Chlamydomonas sp. UWO 241]
MGGSTSRARKVAQRARLPAASTPSCSPHQALDGKIGPHHVVYVHIHPELPHTVPDTRKRLMFRVLCTQ